MYILISYRESCILYLLNGICIAIFGNDHLKKVILEHLLDQYQVCYISVRSTLLLYLYVSLCLSIYISFSLSIYISFSLSLSLSLTLSLSLSLSLPLQLLQPLQQKSRKLLSAVTSSVLSMVGQDGGPPSIYNVIVSVIIAESRKGLRKVSP